jgi:hypothetical protein
MEKKPYGCLTVPGFITALLVLLIVVGVGIVKRGILFSPGPLNAQAGPALGGVTSHAELSARCSACHAFFWQPGATMANRCLACHTDVVSQQQDTASLHGILFKNKPGVTCRYCHPDHLGPNAPLTDLSKLDFSHSIFGYALTAHQHQAGGSDFTCISCHVNGYVTFDQGVCTTCHQQIKPDFMQAHLQAFGAGCLGCHDGIDTYGHNFNHAAVAFQLTGKHVQVDCIGCHTSARSIADLKAAPQDCFSCHAKDDPHQGLFGTSCEACHATIGWLPPTFDHTLSKFPLTGAHVGLACEKCHINNIFTAISIACDSCHVEPASHVGLFQGMTCDQCHTTTAWIPATFDHSQTNFPLTGAHVSLTCAKCHTNGLFTGISSACSSCHTDPAFHAGLFTGMDCSQCHSTSAWLPASFNLPHPASCGEVTCINHEGATCLDCHPTSLSTATCLKCHSSNNPGGDGGGGD